MNKKFVKVAFVAAFAFVVGCEVLGAHKMMGLSEIALANLEALASDEKVDMRRGYTMVIKSSTCSVCEWTGGDNDYCNVHAQLPDCYGGRE